MEKFRLVAVSGVYAAIGKDALEREKDYQINLAMKNLYVDGCRRMRVVPLPRTGDAQKYKIMGWPS